MKGGPGTQHIGLVKGKVCERESFQLRVADGSVDEMLNGAIQFCLTGRNTQEPIVRTVVGLEGYIDRNISPTKQANAASPTDTPRNYLPSINAPHIRLPILPSPQHSVYSILSDLKTRSLLVKVTCPRENRNPHLTTHTCPPRSVAAHINTSAPHQA
jgi:hypothetical protein